jgi:methylmalonyl-CoA/ethylmalonyl-CoA epimerase
MNNPDIEIDHIGIAVNNFSEAAAFWNALGWVSGQEIEEVAEQKVNVNMLPLKNAAQIELLQATEQTSSIAKFISKRGTGIHHICLRVKEIEKLLIHLKSKGIKLINEAPVKGAHGCKVAFVHPSSTGGILIELSEKA